MGAGTATDALFAAMAVPAFVTGVLAIPLFRVLVPFFSAGAGASPAAIGTVLLASAALLTGTALVLSWTAPVWVRALVPGFTDDGVALTVLLLRIQLPGMVLAGVASVLRSAHNAGNRFIYPAAAACVSAAASLVLVLVFLPRVGITAAAWSFAARGAADFLFLLPVGAAVSLASWSPAALRETWRRLHPLIIGSTYERTEVLVDRFLSSLAPAGALSLLSLAQQVHGGGAQILNRSVSDPVVPLLTRLSAERDWRGVRRIIARRVSGIVLISGVGMLLVLLAGRAVLEAIPGVRNLRPEDVRLLWWLVILMAGWLMTDPIANLLANVFYAMGDTATPTRLGVVSYTVGIALKVSGFLAWGVAGMAAASTGYFVLRAALLYLGLRRSVATAS